jgi:tRNA(fMet)-specific endonuclease VapC
VIVLDTDSINHFELLAGARTPDEASHLRTLVRPLAVLPFDQAAADRAGDQAAALRHEGRPLPMADLAIAGICLELGASLLTRNRKHFERIPGLRLEDVPQYASPEPGPSTPPAALPTRASRATRA